MPRILTPLTSELALLPHPLAPGDTSAVRSITASVLQAPDGALTLRYTVLGAIDRLLVPAPTRPGAVDGLWAHTCCEAFIAASGAPSYREFNFSPSGQWAIYDFDDYRSPSGTPTAHPKPTIGTDRAPGKLMLHARIAADALPQGDTLDFGLSAVIETQAGELSYWALRHPGARPDFHHRDAFALSLPRLPQARPQC